MMSKMEVIAKKIVVIGGTGAQGVPVVKHLSKDQKYNVIVLTRDPESEVAIEIEKIPNVSLFKGNYTNESVIRELFTAVHGVFVNLNGFNLGEKAEVYWGVRIWEIAIEEHVCHYVWSSLDYALKKGGYDPKYHCSHYDSKGRVAEFILMNRNSHKMKTSVLTSGPYFEMLYEGLFVPVKKDGEFVWAQPIGDGAVAMIALDDLGRYARWIFDNPERSDDFDLEVASEHVAWDELVSSFMRVNPGKKAVRRSTTTAEFHLLIGIKDGMPYTLSPNADGANDPTTSTWEQNFSAFWAMWRDNIVKRDYALLDAILPDRIRSVEEWMKVNHYNGEKKPLFKDYRLRPQSSR